MLKRKPHSLLRNPIMDRGRGPSPLAERTGDFVHDVLHRFMTDAHCLMTFILLQNLYSLLCQQRPIIRVNMPSAMHIIGLWDLRAYLTF